MIVETVRGCIVVEHTTMTSLDKVCPAVMIYDFYPDRDHGNISTCNLEHYEIKMVDMPLLSIFIAMVNAHGVEKGYDKLLKMGIINKP